MDIHRPNADKRRRHRQLQVAAGAALFVALLAIAWGLASRPPAIDRDDIWTGKVARGQLVNEVAATGTLVARDIRAVTNRSEGVVESIRVLPGQAVGPDDVLIEMSSPALEDELADARYELAAAEASAELSSTEAENRLLDIVAELASAEAEYTASRLELEANEELGEQNITSGIEIERLRLRTEQLLKRRAAQQARLDSYDDYRAAQDASTLANVSKLRERVTRLESRVADLAVRAGTRGVVQEVNVQEGERLQAGHAVARVVNPDHLLARIGVSERDAALVKIGMHVRLELGRDLVTGAVSRIDPTVRDRLVTVDVALDPADHAALRPDLSVIARIELARLEDVLVLDRPVALRDPYSTVALFRLDPDGGHARRVAVEVGGASARQVEIVNGLEPGDVVVLADLSDWADTPVLRVR